MKRITIAALLLFAATPVLSQTTATDLEDTVDSTVQIRQETQVKRDQWADDHTQLRSRLHAARANVEYLGKCKQQASERVAALEDRIAELQRRLEESTRLEGSIQDTLGAILQRLDDWVVSDLPFLPAERQMRLASLRNELARPDVPPSEKLRRLLEALQIETVYGATVEVYQDRIEVAGDTLFVDVLRIGRLSLFWRTPDGRRAGEYERASGEWIELPGKYNRTIGLAVQMATHQRPVELIALPLGRIRP